MKATDQQVKTAIQALADASRKYAKKLNVKYTSFANWIAEPRKPMEVVIKVLRTFTEQDIVAVGDAKLMELYTRAKIVYEYTSKEKE